MYFIRCLVLRLRRLHMNLFSLDKQSTPTWQIGSLVEVRLLVLISPCTGHGTVSSIFYLAMLNLHMDFSFIPPVSSTFLHLRPSQPKTALHETQPILWSSSFHQCSPKKDFDPLVFNNVSRRWIDVVSQFGGIGKDCCAFLALSLAINQSQLGEVSKSITLISEH